MTRGAELRAPDHPLVPMPPFVVPQVYIPPEEKKLTALRITAEPAAHTRAGEPFAGALTAELLDQFGERFLTGDPKGNPHRVRLAMVRTHNATLPPAARLVAPCAVAAVPCTAPRALVALADGGIVSFGDLILNELGGGARFELTLGDLAPVVTDSVYSVSLGPAAKLRFIQMPTEDNLQDVHFTSQPIVEVTDLGGNRVAAGTHVISVDLAAGDGRLRGPRTRHSRHGVANFDRLKILLPGYDKVIKATAAGVAGFSRFLSQCDLMVALISTSYFSRLWRAAPFQCTLAPSPPGLTTLSQVRVRARRLHARQWHAPARRGARQAAAPLPRLAVVAQPVQASAALGAREEADHELQLPRRRLLHAARYPGAGSNPEKQIMLDLLLAFWAP